MNLNETATINLKIQSGEAINELDSLQQRAEELRESMKELEKNGQRTSDEWKEQRKALSEVNAEMKNYVHQMDTADMTVGQLKEAQRLLNKEIKDTVVGTEEYITKANRLQEVNTRLADVRRDTRAIADELDHQKTRWDSFKDAMSGAFAALSLDNIIESIVDFGRKSIETAAKISDAMSDIEKSTGMTAAEVDTLAANLNKIDTRTTIDGLLEIAKVGGQFGIAKDQIEGFTVSVDRAVVALGDEFTGGAEQVAKELGTLKTLFKDTKDLEAGKAINDIGSAINALGSAGSATGPVIADFAARMGQLGDLSPQITQTLGLGAAFQELGLSAEISAGGLSNILLTAAKGVEPFAAQMNLSVQAVRNLINTNPNEFLLKLAESLKGLPADEVAKRLDNMGIKSQEATKVMSLLKDQTQLVRDRQALANTEFQKGTSLIDEFNKKNNNAAAELAKMGKEVTTMSIELGKGLMPVVIAVGSALIAFGKAIMAIPQFVKENKTEMALLAIGLVSFNGHLIAAAASSLALAAAEKGRAIVTSAVTTAQNLLNTAMNLNPVSRLITVFAGLATIFVSLYNHSETFRNGINKLWSYIQGFADWVSPFFGKFVHLIGEGAKAVANLLGLTSDEAKKANATATADHKKALDTKAAANAAANATDKAQHIELTAGKGSVDSAAIKEAADKAKKAREEQAAAIKKHNEEIADDNKKSTENQIKFDRDAKIAAEKDDITRKKLKLDFEYADEMAAIKKSLASQQNKDAELIAAKKKYESEVAKLDQDRADREKKEREEKAKAEAETTARITKYERDAIKSMLDFEESAIAATEKNTANLSLKSRQELSKATMELQKARLKFELESAIANAKEVADKELTRENLTDKEIQLIKTNRDNKIRQIDAKYTADKEKADNDHVSRLRKLDEDELKAKQERNQKYSDIFQSLLKGDFNTAGNLVASFSKKQDTERAKQMQAFAADLEVKGQMATAAVNFLADLSKKRMDKEIANAAKERDEKIKKLDEQLKQNLISKDQYDKAVATANDESRAKEKSAKEKQWKDQQKADIALAVINGLVGATKAFAQGGIFGAIGAAIVLVATGLSIAKIKSTPMPQFRYGGTFLPEGPQHGSKYGDDGYAVVSRRDGLEHAEMEGGEPVINKTVSATNRPLINLLLNRGQNSGDRNKPITLTEIVANTPQSFEKGGIFNGRHTNSRMFTSGGYPVGSNPTASDPENTNDNGSENPADNPQSQSSTVQSLAQESTQASKDIVNELKELNLKVENMKNTLASEMQSGFGNVNNSTNSTTNAVNNLSGQIASMQAAQDKAIK